MMDEMDINFKNSKSIFWWINSGTIYNMRDISTLLAFMINIIYVIDANRYEDFEVITVEEWAHITSYVIAVF